MNGYMKKILSAGLLLCLLGFQGCAAAEADREEEEAETKKEIVLWTYYETNMQKASMDELVSGFNESQEEYHLTWEYHGPVTEFNKRLAIAITQNQLPDMVILDNPDMATYIEMDKLEDITEHIKDIEELGQYFPSAMKSVTAEDRYYGLPFCCNNVALIYNKDILKGAGIHVPQTWEELKRAAKELSAPGRYGFAMSAIDGEQGAFQFGAFMEYYDQTDVMIECMKQYGSFPPKTEAAQDSYWTDDPIQKAFIQQLDTSIPRGPSASWPAYSDAIQTGFQEVMTSAKTPEKASEDTQAAVDKVKASEK